MPIVVLTNSTEETATIIRACLGKRKDANLATSFGAGTEDIEAKPILRRRRRRTLAA
jgi:hypothetical protein